MSYRDSVGSLCVLLGIENPILEADLRIGRLIFFKEGEKIASISATDKNRAGRLFFQHKFSSSLYTVGEARLHGEFKNVAAEYFGALWEDAEERGRALIIALKRADTVQILWKS